LLIRPKVFFVLSLICTLPLLLLSGFLFLSSLRNARSSMRAELENELADVVADFHAVLDQRRRELLTLASSESIVSHFKNHAGAKVIPQEVVSPLLKAQNSYFSLSAFLPDGRVLFVAEKSGNNSNVTFRTETVPGTKDFDFSILNTRVGTLVCVVTTEPSVGKLVRCGAPVRVSGEQSNAMGILVSDLKLDTLIEEVADRSQLSGHSTDNVLIAIDKSGEIVYHPNQALEHQPVSVAMNEFVPVASEMIAGQSGSKSLRSANGDEWMAVYGPLALDELSLAVTRNSSASMVVARRLGWIGLAGALVLGIALAAVLTHYYQRQSYRQSESIRRVSDGVAAIAQGEFDQSIHLSREDIQPLADNVNLLKEQLRNQIAREAETRQFQSFVKLSAMLTHDLKNAITSLSLLVSNMEQHFENEQFRADAMKSLTEATEKLTGLVNRLSNPVTTLSGEYKRPEAIDLAPRIKHIIADIAGPTMGHHEIEIDLPPSLIAFVEGERIDRVIENLVLNAFEAMANKKGKLTVRGGKENSDKIFITFTDTGTGMSRTFIEEKLFHAFATTKRNGMGLGLYTCREVVHANGGTIEVDSKEGVGTTFRVVLPSPQS
jgi:signal transduction histidine kinase